MSRKHQRYALCIVAALLLGFIASIANVFFNNIPTVDGFTMKNGQLLGGDFIAFYVGGRMASQERADLYDLGSQKVLREEILGEATKALPGELPFVYPPLVAIALMPFAAIPFELSFYLWMIVALVFTAAALWPLIRRTNALGSFFPQSARPLYFLLFLLGYVPFSMNTLIGGQMAWIGVCVFALTYLAILRENYFIAGLLFSSSYYKPPLFLFALLCLFISMGSRFRWGFALGALLFVGGSLLLGGIDTAGHYLNTVSRYTYGQEVIDGRKLPADQGAGILGALQQLIPNSQLAWGVYGVLFTLSLLCLLLMRRRVVSPLDNTLWLITVAVWSVGLSIQCIRYDLAILIVPLILALSLWQLRSDPRVENSRLLYSLPLVLLSSFYFEWLLRNLQLFQTTLNISSFLFLFVGIIMIGILYRSTSQSRALRTAL